MISFFPSYIQRFTFRNEVILIIFNIKYTHIYWHGHGIYINVLDSLLGVYLSIDLRFTPVSEPQKRLCLTPAYEHQYITVVTSFQPPTPVSYHWYTSVTGWIPLGQCENGSALLKSTVCSQPRLRTEPTASPTHKPLFSGEYLVPL